MAPGDKPGSPVQETGEQTNSQVQEVSEVQSFKGQEFVLGLAYNTPSYPRDSIVTTANSAIRPSRQKRDSVVICNTTFESLAQCLLETKPAFQTRLTLTARIQNAPIKPPHTSGYGSGVTHSQQDEPTSNDLNITTQIQPSPQTNNTAATVKLANQPPYDFVHGTTPISSSHGAKSAPLFPNLGPLKEAGPEQPPREKDGHRQSNPHDTGKPPTMSKLGYEEAVEEVSSIDTSSSIPQTPRVPSPVVAYHGMPGYLVKRFESLAGDDMHRGFGFPNEEMAPETIPLTRSFTSLKCLTPPHTPLFDGQGFTFNEEDVSLDSGYVTVSNSSTV